MNEAIKAFIESKNIAVMGVKFRRVLRAEGKCDLTRMKIKRAKTNYVEIIGR